jgi:hypothetical protein
MAAAGAMAWTGGRIGLLISCRHLQNTPSSAWIMMVRAADRCPRFQLPCASRHRELHEAGGAEQQHEHNSSGFRRNGHGIHKLQKLVDPSVCWFGMGGGE